MNKFAVLLVSIAVSAIFISGCIQSTGQITSQEQQNASTNNACEHKWLDNFSCNGNTVIRTFQTSNCTVYYGEYKQCDGVCEKGSCVIKEQLQTREPCKEGYLNKPFCKNDYIYDKFQSSDCVTTEVQKGLKCEYGCQDGRCLESTPTQTNENTLPSYTSNSVKFANWNLQIFGQTKASNQNLMNLYRDTISHYDIIFIQEIRDSSQTAFPKLCSMLPDYECEVSSRAGRTTSKEQYGIIYKKGIQIISVKDFNPDSEDRWERPPIEVSFVAGDYEITVYNIHAKPDDVKLELSHLESVVSTSGNVMVLGDLNADCAYYSAVDEIEFDSWNWIIKDDDDTTATNTYCAYDRILLNNDAYVEYASSGIHTNSITTDVSDHYLVWVEFKA